MPKRGFLTVTLLALLIVLAQATRILAGTTGGLSGQVRLSDGTGIAGVNVTATSPSESVSTKTDANGHFVFVSLVPDTYTIVISKDGYNSVSQAGITVIADNTQTVTLNTERTVKVIGVVPVRAATELVKPGTTSDVYSINSRTAAKLTALGGGGAMDSAYSAIATVPGAYVPTGSAGWYQTVLIRGGDYDQVGYEFDGVPINRSFDNYPTGGAGTLGQQELQVYTGSAPANAESQGLAGFINQVIKTGTYPGYGNLDVAVGAPNLYNKLDIEVGGATPNRNFSYYLGAGGYAYGERFYDNGNGASVSPTWGTLFGPATAPLGCADSSGKNYVSCYASGVGPGGYLLGPFQAAGNGTLQDRENIMNLHFGIPHRNDSGKDDIQLLYSTFLLRNPYQNSLRDWGAGLYNAVGAFPPLYIGGNQYNGSLGQLLGNACTAPCNVIPMSFPSSGVAPGMPIPASLQDSSENGQGIGKIQYQHNIGSTAYVRVYAYSYYSWWYLHGPNTAYDALFVPTAAEPTAIDYELSTHTRGLSATFADQISSSHLLNLEVSSIAATADRYNSTTGINGLSGRRQRFAVMVDSNNPLSGICYDATDAPTGCNTDTTRGPVTANWLRLNNVMLGGVPSLTGQTCGTGPCAFLAVENGNFAKINTIKPTFSAISLTDQWKMTDKLLFNYGVRVDRYQYQGSDTTGSPARTFWYNAWNQDNCISTAPGSTPVQKEVLGITVLQSCSAVNPTLGTFVAVNEQNVSAPTFTFTDAQPRIGGTYTINSDNVIRFNFGKYAQAANTAFEQYTVEEQNQPLFLAPTFNKYGYSTPGHGIPPENSYNFDVSLEHHFANTDASLKLTPFYRKTKGQFQTFFLDQKTSFISGLPAGDQTSEGVELQFNKGDFGANGFAYMLSYAYTHAYINYFTLSNGGTTLSPVNLAIKQYNGYTQFCATNPTASNCGPTSSGAPAAACYTSGGTPDPSCAAGDIANPYWLAPAQPLLNETANYPVYSLIPNGFEQSVGSNDVPHVLTVVLNYKHDKWAFTPIVAFHSGNAYGAPLLTSGIDPAAGGCAALGGSTSGDPRYPYGAGGGSPYDAMSCSGTLAGGIPNPFTGSFDSLGAFRGPSQLQAHLGITYEATPRTTFVVNLVNLVNTCFGGSNEPWTNQPNTPKNRVCSYALPGVGLGTPSAGNVYNPGSTFQQQVQYPYAPSFGSFSPNGGGIAQTFAATFEMKLKL
jgi:carboxypeptidase family protein/TonB-dependent receptor-like protein